MRYVAESLAITSAASVLFFAARVIAADNLRYSYLLWNLFLAWIPLLCAYGLRVWLRRGRWSAWQGIALSFLWLGFLPNSFYLISDFVHLQPTYEVGLLFDAVMFMSFAFSGVLLGFTAIYIVEQELRKRFGTGQVWAALGCVFVLCSFAVYLGRFLAWNSWDVIVNPAGLLFDVSDRLINPGQYTSTFTTTLMFTVLTASMYAGLHRLIRGLRSIKD
jgi:uncharacterized membrane protein